MSSLPIKLRFAPSPTGLMHLGNTRTALFSALYAKSQQGIFMLRIEDTDKQRSTQEFTEQLLSDLRWLGLNWQEGPGEDLGHGPYFQSERLDIYQAYYQFLTNRGYLYPCFCSEETLAITRKLQAAAGQPPRYPGTCTQLTQEDVDKRVAAGEVPALRFRVPKDVTITFNDLVKGPQSFQSNDIGDFIIRRTDGTAPFMYCNAIDDALMEVTHVMRGEDHLTNTPRQIMILQALGLRVPEYAHISLIVGSDGSPLSKRHGSRSIYELRQEGFLPQAIINYLARLGHSYDDIGYADFEALAQAFQAQRLSKSPARFDAEQLRYWQKEAVSRLDFAAFWRWVGKAVHSVVPPEVAESFVATVKPNCVFPEDALVWATRCFDTHLTFEVEQQALIRASGSAFFTAALKALEQHGTDYAAICQQITDTLGIKGKALYQPLRVALTHELHGPQMQQLVPLMGEEQVAKRLRQALHVCEQG